MASDDKRSPEEKKQWALTDLFKARMMLDAMQAELDLAPDNADIKSYRDAQALLVQSLRDALK